MKKVVMEDIRRKIGWYFSIPSISFLKRLWQRMWLSDCNLGLTQEETDIRVKEAIEMVGLDYDRVKNLSPFDLSGGQKRRVAIAGVIATEAGSSHFR